MFQNSMFRINIKYHLCVFIKFKKHEISDFFFTRCFIFNRIGSNKIFEHSLELLSIKEIKNFLAFYNTVQYTSLIVIIIIDIINKETKFFIL